MDLLQPQRVTRQLLAQDRPIGGDRGKIVVDAGAEI
jgi:hypothetical protein